MNNSDQKSQNTTDMTAHSPSILVFDSGAGGLSIAREILLGAPTPAMLHYVADTQGFPYGTQDDSTLIRRIHEVISSSIERCQPDVVVLACNTASTLALASLRQQHAIPFVGVVPAIKPAAALSKTGHIALLATHATITRPYTHQLIADFAADKHVSLIGSDKLVELAEDYIAQGKLNIQEIQHEMTSVFAELPPQNTENARIDTVVLACTHFPLLLNSFKHIYGDDIHWVDSGVAVARRLWQVLNRRYLAQASAAPPEPANVDVTLVGYTDKASTHQAYLRYLAAPE